MTDDVIRDALRSSYDSRCLDLARAETWVRHSRGKLDEAEAEYERLTHNVAKLKEALAEYGVDITNADSSMINNQEN